MVYLKVFILGFCFSLFLFNNLSAGLYEENCQDSSSFGRVSAFCSDGLASIADTAVRLTGWDDPDIRRMRSDEKTFEAGLKNQKLVLLASNYFELLRYFWEEDDIIKNKFSCENGDIINEELFTGYGYSRKLELREPGKPRETIERRRALARELIVYQRALYEIEKEVIINRRDTVTVEVHSSTEVDERPNKQTRLTPEASRNLERLQLARFAILNSYPILDTEGWKDKSKSEIFKKPSDSEITVDDENYVMNQILDNSLAEIQANILREAEDTCDQSKSSLVTNDFFASPIIAENGTFTDIYCREYDRVKGKSILKNTGLVALTVVAVVAAPLSGSASLLSLGSTIVGAGATAVDIGIAINDVSNYYDLQRAFLTSVANPDGVSAIASYEELRSARTQAVLSGIFASAGALGESIGIVRTFRAVKWAKSITISEKAWDHVDGVIDTNTKKLKGGMHTEEGLDQFISITGRQPIEDITLPNGVRRVKFEIDAFTTDGWKSTEKAARNGIGVPGGKTIFPANWTKEKIAEAVKHISIPENALPTNKSWQSMYEGVYDGVKIRVAYANNELISVYPAWSQPL